MSFHRLLELLCQAPAARVLRFHRRLVQVDWDPKQRWTVVRLCATILSAQVLRERGIRLSSPN